MFQPVFHAATPVLALVAGRWLRVNPDLALNQADRETAHIISEWIEGAAAGKIEPCVVPVAGKDSVFDAAPVQRKAHVRTAVVHSIRLRPLW